MIPTLQLDSRIVHLPDAEHGRYVYSGISKCTLPWRPLAGARVRLLILGTKYLVTFERTLVGHVVGSLSRDERIIDLALSQIFWPVRQARRLVFASIYNFANAADPLHRA